MSQDNPRDGHEEPKCTCFYTAGSLGATYTEPPTTEPDPLCPVDFPRNWAAYRVLAKWMGFDADSLRGLTLAMIAAMDADDEAHEIRRVEREEPADPATPSAHEASLCLYWHTVSQWAYPPSDFARALLHTLGYADMANRARLALGWPGLVAAWEMCEREDFKALEAIAATDRVEADE